MAYMLLLPLDYYFGTFTHGSFPKQQNKNVLTKLGLHTVPAFGLKTLNMLTNIMMR